MALALPVMAEASTPIIPPKPERKMHLGLVTYNVAKDWDLDTLLGNCKAAGIEGVEFRTTHAHGVEPTLDADGRKRIRDKVQAAGLLQTSLGSICEFQSADSAIVKQNIETCRSFIQLAKDIGARAVKDPQFAGRLKAAGADPLGNTPDEFAALIKADTATWADAVAVTGLNKLQ